MHAPKLPESSRHWKLEPDSLALNPRLAVSAVVVAAGPLVIVVSGGVVSVGGRGWGCRGGRVVGVW